MFEEKIFDAVKNGNYSSSCQLKSGKIHKSVV